jgi:hypothetical protein
MSEHIEAIARAVERAADCPATHVETVAVVDTLRGQTMWEGTVEVFALLRHPQAQRAYGWIEGKGQDRRFTAVLEIPPVVDALTAVRASIVSQSKK